ncbi:beta-galactosidase-1-like protein isoform X2 [Mus musculus]|uniref:beta-galactosidase-1-like protein isoform X2 n=2 Tax=Mus musculus TaxID=10090 RepID=UPI0005ABABE0|nr:beta-galactosidase-1-like protein isoform X2 [Mus musculus]|eukprot:XP_011237015.1 PREDICTED: beta-galactosidase-1-like protein isoform X2 [Mus musculus]
MPPDLPSLLLRLVVLLLLSQAEARSFVVDREHDRFLLDGVPFRYVSGSLHYFRVPPVLWADRLLKMQLSGLNAVQFYVPWNYHEPEPGIYNFNGSRDLIAFLNEAAKVNLLVILRPGPYICAEWEMGGLPSWLLRNPNIHLRTSDPADNVTRIFSLLREYEPHGPLVNSEYYTGWLDYWGQNHSTRSSPAVAQGLEKMLKLGASVNMYMFHGGTNFGYWNGADEKGRFLPITTSYDYDAPISEAGDPTPKLFAIRNVISKFQEIPLGPLPPPSPKMKFGPLTMSLDGNLLSFLDFLCPQGPIHSVLPLTFEAVKLDHGFMLYRTYLTSPVLEPTPFWVPNNGIHDRAYVMVDGVLKGVLERSLKQELYLTGTVGTRLDILLENMGRLSFGSNHSDFKGLLEAPLLGQTILTEWMMFPLKVDKLVKWWFPLQLMKRALPQASSVPAFYSAKFPVFGLLGDTFLYLPGWTKGQVWINGFNLGRYWTMRGPQQTLYVPRLLLFGRSINKITLLELENVPHNPQVQFLDKPILNSTLHWGYNFLLSETQGSFEPMELSGH